MNKNNKLFRILAVLFALALTIMAIPSVNVKAATSSEVKDEIPTKVRIMSRSVYSSAIQIKLVDEGYKLKNLKSNNTNLKVYNTYVEEATDSDYNTEFRIGCYARKTGKYKVSFDLVKGSKKTHKSVTVFAKDDEPIKKVTFGNKRVDYNYTSNSGNYGRMGYPDSGVLKVTMRGGYKLKKIEIGKYETKSYSDGDVYSSENYVEVSNGATITLSDVPYTYKNTSSSYANETEYMVAETEIRVTYIDKYTKTEATRIFDIYKLVKWA